MLAKVRISEQKAKVFLLFRVEGPSRRSLKDSANREKNQIYLSFSENRRDRTAVTLKAKIILR
jgi:hypothetical protein